MNTITKLFAVVALAPGLAACGSANPAQAAPPGSGSYDTAPLNVQLRTGGDYTESVVDDVVTSSGKFEVVWRVVNVGESGTVTGECSGQAKASDIHMLVYSNRSQVNDEAAIESTCSLDPGYSVALQPGQSLNLFAQFATPPALGNQVEIRALSYGTSQFNPYGSYARRSSATPLIPQWMLSVLECVVSFIPGDKGKGINAAVGAGTLPFGLSAVIQEFGNKPAPDTLAGYYEVFRQLPAVPFGACLPTAVQISQWLHGNHGATGPGIPGPPAPVVGLSPAPCTAAAMVGAINAAKVESTGSWALTSYACKGSYSYVTISPQGLAVVAILKQQGSTWKIIYGPNEGLCLTEPLPSFCHGSKLPLPWPVLKSLMNQADRDMIPNVYVHNGYELGSLYEYPNFPATIGLDNHDFLSGLQWTQVSLDGATATGTLNVDNCTPACASGTEIRYSVQLQASDPQQCTVAVYAPDSDVSQQTQAYVFNQFQVTALSGNPPSYLVGSSPPVLPAACG